VEAPMSSTAVRRAARGAPSSWRAWQKDQTLGSVQAGVARHIIRYNLYGHRAGGAQPLDAMDAPAAPVGDDPAFARLVMSLRPIAYTEADWKLLLLRLRGAGKGKAR